MKMDLLRRHFTPAIEDVNGFSSCGNSFIIKEVKSTSRNGRGIPQSLRAFARVLCSTSPQELSDLAKEAAQTDGRLARHPLKNMTTELQAHEFLLSRISRSIEGYSAAIKPLGAPSYPRMHDKVAQRRQLAQDLLNGELRVLQSAAAWLKNYCKTL